MRQVIVVHFGRSGSTVVAKMIEAHPEVEWLHELYTVILQKLEDKSDYRFTCGQMVNLLEDAIAGRATSSTALIGAEAKLINFIHSGLCSLQEFFQELSRKQGWEVVVLRRRNTLARVLSLYRAAGSGVYHVSVQGAQESLKFTMPLSNLHDPDTGVHANSLPEFLEAIGKREENAINNLKSEMDVALELWYEDDIRENPSDAYKKFEKAFGLESATPPVTLQRTAKDMREEVVNFDEISAALKDTEFSWMIDDLLIS